MRTLRTIALAEVIAEPYHAQSFELIESKSDRWLLTVRRLAKKPKSEDAVASPIISGTSPD